MQYVCPEVANEINLPIVAKASGNDITSGTINFYLKALNGDNAGKWWKDSNSTWNATEQVAKVATHSSKGHWYASLKAAAWIQDIRYLLYGYESGGLHIALEDQVVAFDPADVTWIKNVLEGDAKIDTTVTPWNLVIYVKGTSTELIRKELKDISGTDLTAITTVIGQQVEP